MSVHVVVYHGNYPEDGFEVGPAYHNETDADAESEAMEHADRDWIGASVVEVDLKYE